MNREKFKTLILFFSFISAIVLVFLNFYSINYAFIFEESYKNTISVQETLNFVFKPERVLIHFGGGKNTEIIENKEDYWKESKEILKEELIKEKSLEEIPYEEYELKKNIKSIELKFPKGINGNIVNKAILLEKSSISKVEGLSAILIPLVDDKSIYFLGKGNKPYRMKTFDVKSMDIVNKLEEKNQYVQYYTIHYIFTIKNNTLLPGDTNFFYPALKVHNAVDVNDDKQIQNIAKNVFNEKYDFTNRIVETNGSNTFIYGYGEKVLRINEKGVIEFSSENIASKDLSVEKALVTALDFLRKQDPNLIKDLYLSGIYKEKINNRKAYSFGFSSSNKGLNIKMPDLKPPIEIKVIGENIYSYKNGMKKYVSLNPIKEKIIAPQDVLNINFERLKKDLNYSTGVEVLKNLKDVSLIYFLKDEDKLIPAWCILVGERMYIFDAHKGEVLKYGLAQN